MQCEAIPGITTTWCVYGGMVRPQVCASTPAFTESAKYQKANPLRFAGHCAHLPGNHDHVVRHGRCAFVNTGSVRQLPPVPLVPELSREEARKNIQYVAVSAPPSPVRVRLRLSVVAVR